MAYHVCYGKSPKPGDAKPDRIFYESKRKAIAGACNTLKRGFHVYEIRRNDKPFMDQTAVLKACGQAPLSNGTHYRLQQFVSKPEELKDAGIQI
jgi:hypothetical protein